MLYYVRIMRDHPYGEVSEERDYPKRQGGKNQNLPVRNKYRSQDYVLINPFSQIERMGFIFWQKKAKTPTQQSKGRHVTPGANEENYYEQDICSHQ